jgi:hypothetical protein
MIKLFQFLLVLMLTLCLGFAYASSEINTDYSVNKSDWAAVMRYRMPLFLCTIDSPFVKCSDVSQSQCKELALKTVDSCLSDNDKSIPRLLNKTESGDWGAVIGDCSGRKLFSSIEFKEDKNLICSEYLKPSAAISELPQDRIKEMISNSPNLIQLDAEMQNLYHQIELSTQNIDAELQGLLGQIDSKESAVDSGTHINNTIRKKQLLWENTVKNQCKSTECLEKAYIKRIDEMKKIK